TTGWDERHSPGTFTYASHAAFFAGFLPTPARPGRHARPLALGFDGSTSIAPTTCVLEGATIVEGLAARGYHTLCVGGVGFFNLQNPLGRALPALFAEQHWERRLGVTEPRSFEYQIDVIETALGKLPAERRAFTFLNVSALHQPNYFYDTTATDQRDTRRTHAAALRYIDTLIPRLFDVLGARGPLFAIACSDHGTLYGEDGFVGHRVAHPIISTVPYAEVVIA
ncbi:MAG: STM4013/SEN3800 family hydrolase, partial [Deltaproteobacteria bacterium]|nr:STM4013/SEN3800 family hydrolase [Deltaproteobacteria bacterium]